MPLARTATRRVHQSSDLKPTVETLDLFFVNQTWSAGAFRHYHY